MICKGCKQPLKPIPVILDYMVNRPKEDYYLDSVERCDWCNQEIYNLQRKVNRLELERFWHDHGKGYLHIQSVSPYKEKLFLIIYVYHGFFQMEHLKEFMDKHKYLYK